MNVYLVETDNILHNYRLLKEQAGESVIWAVVKGNGYGLGAAALAELLASAGADHFAVTALEEARALRQRGITGDILMLRETADPEELRELVELGVICTLGSVAAAEMLQTVAAAENQTARAHCKIDTGMSRYGFLPGQEGQAEMLWHCAHIRMEGIYTHFPRGGNDAVTKAQFARFQTVVEHLRSKELDVGMVHCCNSLAFWYQKQMRLDGVRLGSALLGRVSYARAAGLKKVGRAQGQVEALKTIPRGTAVGYGGDCVVRRDTRIAVVGIGYLHGFAVERGYDVFRVRDCLRSMGRYLKYMLKGRQLTVEIHGKSCRVLGHVGMVNLIADVTDVPCSLLDPVTVQINPLDLKAMEIRYQKDS